jgi:hypothetical protein
MDVENFARLALLMLIPGIRGQMEGARFRLKGRLPDPRWIDAENVRNSPRTEHGTAAASDSERFVRVKQDCDRAFIH